MTDKLSERMRNTRAESFPNTIVGNSTMDIWADEVAALEQRVARLEGALALLKTLLQTVSEDVPDTPGEA